MMDHEVNAVHNKLIKQSSMKTPTDESWPTCPLTGAPFVEPVIDYEGNTYEKEAILEWLKNNSTSPITRNPLSPDQLFPNRALKDAIIDGDENSSVPSTVNSSPLTSDDDQETDNTELSELARKAVLQTAFSETDGLGIVRVQVPDDDSKRHLPASIVCVIDESYSMDGAATTQEDQEGNSGLSLLDIVKHATKTVIETLGPEDQLAIVTYADSAEVRLPFMKMTINNKARASQVVESFQTRGSTNLWGGLLQAMDLAKEDSATNVFLLTDGLPNIHPPRGELETLQRYKMKQNLWNCRISTFGFGYSLDSTLLNDIAIEGDGQYFFIPDSSFVGTVFINATSFVLSSALNTSTVSFDSNSRPIQDCTSQTEASSCGHSFSLVSLSYGQTFDLLIDVDIDKEGHDWTSAITHIDIKTARLRTGLVSLIRSAEKRFSDGNPEALSLAQEDVQNLIGLVKVAIDSCGSGDSDRRSILQAMKEDLTGQITEAYSREDWHNKWGRHYLLSLARAHELQRCTNFKDPGLQIYATRKFSLIRDMAEDVFCMIPPPKPSRRRNNSNYRPVTSMSTYYNSAAGCLAEGNVRLADGRYIPVSLVAPGNILQVPCGLVRVRCVVTTQCENGVQDLVELEGGVLVTPWHPVRVKGTNKWRFPADLAPIKSYSCDVVYNFVLEDGVSVPIGPFEAITLGHGIVDDPVANHEYFGCNKVVRDLSQMIGWSQGRVHLGCSPGKRDPESGLITSFVQHIGTNALRDNCGAATIDSMSLKIVDKAVDV
jgi:hypothetical protein